MLKNIAMRLVAVVITLVIPSHALAQNPAYGMVTHYVDDNMGNKMQELGAGFVRVDFNWYDMEPGRGYFIWGPTDSLVFNARSRGLLVFATLAYTPPWANDAQGINVPPYDLQDWYDFVYAVVQHYQADVWHFGMWNEPNLPNFFYGTIYQYETLVSVGRQAVKDANPGANVVGPEVSWHAVCSGWFGQVMDSLWTAFDIVSVHYYFDACTDPGSFMDAYVAPQLHGRPVWVSEVGWSTCTGGEDIQSQAYNTMLNAYIPRKGGYWTGLFFYDLYESGGCSWAIARPDWSNRPAFNTYQWWIQNYP
jgi:glycosyl hydrolase family 39 (putative alpha-L-iduronidase)